MKELKTKFLDRLYDWMLLYGPRILIAIGALIIGLWVIRLLSRWISNFLGRKKMDATIRSFMINSSRTALQVLLVLVLMQVLGIRMTLFTALIAAFGVAAGLALSGTLQNFTSGILIILFRPFRVGDNIRTQGEEGTVESIRLFYTVLVTYNNTTLILPNSKLANEVIFNLTRKDKRRLEILLKFPPAMDFGALREKIIKLIENNKAVLQDPPLRIGIEKIENDGYTVSIHAWLNAHGFTDSKYLLNEQLLSLIKPPVNEA